MKSESERKRDTELLKLQNALNLAYNQPTTVDAVRASAQLRALLPDEANLKAELTSTIAPDSLRRAFPVRVRLESHQDAWRQWLRAHGRAEDEMPFERWLVEQQAIPAFRKEWNQQHLYPGLSQAVPTTGLRGLLADRAIADMGDTDYALAEEYVNRTIGIIQTNYYNQQQVIMCLSPLLWGSYQAVVTQPIPLRAQTEILLLTLESMTDSRRIWCTPPKNVRVSVGFPSDGWFTCEIDSKGLYFTLTMSRQYSFIEPRLVSVTAGPDTR